MPYIGDKNITKATNAGELNYLITKEINNEVKELNYNKINDIITFLELLKQQILNPENSYWDDYYKYFETYELKIMDHLNNSCIKPKEMIGVLECVKLEFYRRVAAPYEDLKKEENGDVYNV